MAVIHLRGDEAGTFCIRFLLFFRDFPWKVPPIVKTEIYLWVCRAPHTYTHMPEKHYKFFLSAG
jgi:hypothetical protein